jgi:hypothetical protein
VPAEPSKPDSHARACQWSGRYSDMCGSALGTRQAATPWVFIALRSASMRVELGLVMQEC